MDAEWGASGKEVSKSHLALLLQGRYMDPTSGLGWGWPLRHAWLYYWVLVLYLYASGIGDESDVFPVFF